MGGVWGLRKAGVASAVLAFLWAEPTFGQPTVLPPPTTAPGTEIYYGVTPFAPVTPPEELPLTIPGPSVVPAIIEYTLPPAPQPSAGMIVGVPKIVEWNRPQVQTALPLHGALDVVREGARPTSSTASTVIENLTPPREPRPESKFDQTPPAEFSLAKTSTSLPPAPPVLAGTGDADGTISLSMTRLVTLIAIAVGVAVGILGVGMAFLFVRRRDAESYFEPSPTRFTPPPITDLPTKPLEISEKGLPASSEPPRNEGKPRPAAPAPPRPVPPMKAVQPRPGQKDEAVEQFILDQNLAVLMAISTGKDDLRSATDVGSTIRIS
jgi:hypothetical protein